MEASMSSEEDAGKDYEDGMDYDNGENGRESFELEDPMEDLSLIRPPRPKRAKSGDSQDGTAGESNEDEEEEDEEEEESTIEHSKLNESGPAPLSNADGLINVGSDYQAVIDQTVAKKVPLKRDAGIDRDEPIWENPDGIDDNKLLQYIGEATGRFRVPIDRSLYILKGLNFDFEDAIKEVEKRRELFDYWSTEETSLFSNCYFHFGKKFKKIQVAMPHRSLGSIIQFYYNTKKRNNYKTIVDSRWNDADEFDHLNDEIKKMSKVVSGTCENCKRKCDVLIYNKPMDRHECRACVLYFRIMRVPRPTRTRSCSERREKPVCPEYMKKYVLNYEMLNLPADGKAAERLHLKVKTVDDDDECMIIDDDPIRRPSEPYLVETTEDEDPYDANTCRMTRDIMGETALKVYENLKNHSVKSIQLVWRKKQNRSMEECELLNEEARNRIMGADRMQKRVNVGTVEKWKKEMLELRHRQERRKPNDEPDSQSAGTRSGKIRHDFHWSDEEKRNVVKCFHWYKDDFEAIAEVMGSKTQDQIRIFYKNNEDLITKSIKKYRHAIASSLPTNR
uniref:SANT domain-containing protein n=1 Tax=Caenorhabditis japonica TaxID=281687 RepID=A0A8R1DPE0_CAEJA